MRARGGDAGGELAPGLKVTEIGGECAKCIVANAFAGEVLEGIDVVVGQKCGESVAAIEGQDGLEGVELLCTPQHSVGNGRRLHALAGFSHRFAAASV